MTSAGSWGYEEEEMSRSNHMLIYWLEKPI